MPLQEGEGKRIMKRREPDREEGEPCLECKATVLNINAGRNNDMMRKCRRLSDYAEFIAQIRWKMDEGWSLEEATEISIRRCIEKGILSDILTKYGMEVYRMILTEYNEKEEREYLRRESWKEGREEGRMEMLQEVVLDRLEELGTVPETVKKRILSTDDTEQLKLWNKQAIMAGSIEDFIKRM